MRQNVIAVAVAIGVSAGIGCSADAAPDVSAAESASEEEIVRSVQQAQISGQVVVGAVLFNLGFPATGGNGRACATCHVPTDDFQLTPAHVEARYQALQARRLKYPHADDPLFRSIDANDGVADFTNLRNHALVTAAVKLPVDASGEKLVWPVDDPTADTVRIWRATPSIRNVGLTAPYQQDGSVATLPAQALGALQTHTQITRAPHLAFLDAVAAFQAEQFSSRGVRNVADALGDGRPPADPDPALTPLEQQGKVLFGQFCALCHGGPTQTTPAPFLAARQNIMVSKPLPPPALPFASGFRPSPLVPRLWAFRVPGGGPPIVRPSTDPGKALVTGNVNDINQFDVPALFGIAKTAPYFHDNSAADLEEVMTHYIAFFQFLATQPPPPGAPGPLPLLTTDHIAPLVAYMKKI